MVLLAFEWRHLLFANWPVDPDVVAAELPEAFDVETFDGDAWLSIVPFVNGKLRPKGLPKRVGVTLPELNLRTYVTHEGVPGVYFFSLDLPSLLGTVGARVTHHLPYYYSKANFDWSGTEARFDSRRRHPGAPPVRFGCRYAPTGEATTSEPGSLRAFLTERRRLYARDGNGDVRYTDVDHDHWELAPATATLDCDELFAANGFEFPESEPTLLYASGVDVTTTSSKRWTDRPLPAPPRDRRMRSGPALKPLEAEG